MPAVAIRGLLSSRNTVHLPTITLFGTTGSVGSTQRIDEHTGARVNSCRVVCGKSGGRG
jgi:hypothetical protein